MSGTSNVTSFSTSLFIGLVGSVLAAQSVRAGGSFPTDQVIPLLQQNPALYKFVTETLDLDSGGWALRIGSRVNSVLGGARIAPYSIKAKPKGSKDTWQFYLEIDADTTFYDAAGKAVALEDGKSIKEKLTGVRVIPIPDADKH